MTNPPSPPRRRRRPTTASSTSLVAIAALLAILLASGSGGGGADAFSSPPSSFATRSTFASSSSFARAERGDDGRGEELDVDLARPSRAIATATASSALLLASLLFAAPLLDPPPAHAAASAPIVSETSTSIDIKLSSLPSLTRRVVANREQLTNYLIDAAKSFKPILDAVSESGTVAVQPPRDVKGAINQALTKGDASFLVNGQPVDVRVESVPGVVVVRITNPNIPRLPFLRDGTAALKFVDEIVDAAPAGVERAAEEVEAIERFLTWGAPARAPITYKGSSLDYFLSGEFTWGGRSVGVTNGEAAFLGLGSAIVASYAASYSYYIQLQEEAEREAAEKKEQMAAKKKAAAAKKKAAAEKAKAEEESKAAEEAKVEEEAPLPEPVMATEEGAAAEEANEAPAKEEERELVGAGGVAETPRVRKRDRIKKFFGRGEK